jgi:hypothetical protein
MQHSSHPQEMADAVAWLQQRLPQPLPTEAELRAMSNSELKRLAGSRCGSSTHACTGCRVVATGRLFWRRLCASRSVLGEFPPQDSRRRTISCRLFWSQPSFSTHHDFYWQRVLGCTAVNVTRAKRYSVITYTFNSWKEACPP